MILTGANSATGLRSMAAKYIFFAEVDAYPADVDGEGDPIDLGLARTQTFARHKIYECSHAARGRAVQYRHSLRDVGSAPLLCALPRV